MDGPKAIIRVDPAPGFVALKDDITLQSLGICIEIGRIKNVNKNPVAEKAIAELEEELLRQEPGGGPVTELGLAIASARLNSRIRSQGLSSRELWTQRNQFTNEQLPFTDRQLILEKHNQRLLNHAHSEKAKNPHNRVLTPAPLQVGDIVYLYSDRDKSRARSRYIIVSIDNDWCCIKKFSGCQLRASSYKVKLCECYKVPATFTSNSRPSGSAYHSDEEEVLEVTEQPSPAFQPPEAPLDLLLPYAPEVSNEYPMLISDPSDSEPDNPITQESSSSTPSATISTSEPEAPIQRPQRSRKLPQYLQDYVLD